MIAIIGDFHIPNRASEIPGEFVSFLRDSEMIVCTGDLTDAGVLRELKSYAPVKIVRGNMDDFGYPEKEIFRIGKLKFGLVHGSGIYPRGDEKQLYNLAKDMGVDVLVSGHTHVVSIKKIGDVLLLNPGSATGVFSGGGIVPNPSFLTADIREKEIYINKYELREGLKKERYIFRW